MTWHISAGGHTPAAEGETDWSETELKLFGELQAVLSKPEYGAGTSEFHGNYVHGEPHRTDNEPRNTAEEARERGEPAP